MLQITRLILLAVTLSIISNSCSQLMSVSTCQSCAKISKNKINVHIIPHSHNDVGWLKTFDQYYYSSTDGFRTGPGVQYILSSVVTALLHHKNRRYVQAETAFFWKWWRDQNQETRKNFQDLVNSGQIEIVGGGMVINDEAITNYQSIIDQFTWGLRILNDTIGPCARPKVAWQIDSFGHSREMANILYRIGFEGLVLERIDFNDKKKRLNHSLEFLWQTSDTNENAKIFTTMFPVTRNSEDHFCYDILCSFESIVDDPDSPDYNLVRIKEEFESKLLSYKVFYQTNNLMIPMGGDFHYQAAEINFANLDKLIKSFENHQQLNVFYSTPSCYLNAVKSEMTSKSIVASIKSDDFLPIASAENSYWSGFYSSRPQLKRFERMGHGILQSVKQLATLSRLEEFDEDENIQDLREVMGILQHHDAITGTSKQAVAKDYTRMLSRALNKALKSANKIINFFLSNNPDKTSDLQFEACLLSNVSLCKTSKEDKFLVVVQNPQSYSVNYYVRLPVDATSFDITGPDGKEFYDIFTPIHNFGYVKEDVKPAKYDLVFWARDIPALGLKVYFIEKAKTTKKNRLAREVYEDSFELGDQHVGLTIKDCLLTSATIESETINITQEFFFYSSVSNEYTQFESQRNSGAYIFRPQDKAQNLTFNRFCFFSKGGYVEEAVQVFGTNLRQIIRLYKTERYIEFDWIVGDLDFVNNSGIELISRFTVDNFNNDETFFTDSNGRQLLQRRLNERPTYSYNYKAEPIASNYYPISSQISICDKERNLEVAVLTDRGAGGTSLDNGQIELMIYRRLKYDDHLGVGEAMNDLEYFYGVYVRGQHYLVFGKQNDVFVSNMSLAAYQKKLVMYKLNGPLIMLSSVDDNVDNFRELFEFKYDVLTKSLPNNVNLLTFEPWLNSYLLRLEHYVSVGLDENLSKNVVVNLKGFFKTFEITGIRETNLAGNVFLEDSRINCPNIADCSPSVLEISLDPMIIRTFIITTNKNNKGGKINEGNNDDNKDDSGTSLEISKKLIVLLLFMYLLPPN